MYLGVDYSIFLFFLTSFVRFRRLRGGVVVRAPFLVVVLVVFLKDI